MADKFEYRIVRTYPTYPGARGLPEPDEAAIAAKLNEVGSEGWELVTVTYVPESGPQGDRSLLHYFRRSLP